jgi:hypothetical protein
LGCAAALGARFDKFAGYISRDFESLGDSSALRYQALEFIGSSKEQAFGQFFDLYSDGQFHVFLILPGLRVQEESRGLRAITLRPSPPRYAARNHAPANPSHCCIVGTFDIASQISA